MLFAVSAFVFAIGGAFVSKGNTNRTWTSYYSAPSATPHTPCNLLSGCLPTNTGAACTKGSNDSFYSNSVCSTIYSGSLFMPTR